MSINEVNIVKKDGKVVRGPTIMCSEPSLKEALVNVMAACSLTPYAFTQIVSAARLACTLEQLLWGEEMRTFIDVKSDLNK